MKKLALSFLLLLFVAPLASKADAQVVVEVGHHHHHRHYYHHHYHHYDRR